MIFDENRWTCARDRIIFPGERVRSGIGVQKEKTLHAILKNYYEPDASFHEKPVKGYIADISKDDVIIEIQTANMEHMRNKLDVFLPDHKVRIVYPIPHFKWVVWLNSKNGQPEQRNKSHFTGSYYQAFRELYKISSFLAHPNLSIDLVLVDLEEYRYRDGWSKDGKRGSHRFDLIPLTVYDTLSIDSPADYAKLIPADLPEQFSSADMADCLHIHRKSVSFSMVLKIMTDLGIVERVGITRRRAYLYKRSTQNVSF